MRLRVRIVVVFVSLLAVGGCAGLKPRGQWRELTSAHLHLATNVDAGAARREVVRLETALASLAALAAPEHALPPRLDVLWLANEDDVELLGVGSATTGFYLPHQYGEPSSPPLIVVGGQAGEPLDRRFMHELTHVLLVDALPDAPPWVTEGLAGWFATLNVDRGTIGFPADVRSLADYYRRTNASIAGLRTVLGSDERAYHHRALGPWLYRGAATFVGMLESSPDLRPRFADYLARLGRGERQPAAWVPTLGALWLGDLERDYEAFQLAAPVPVKLSVYAGEPVLLPLSPASVERWFARARPWDSREALVAAGANLKRAVGDDSAERHYWSGVYAARWRRWGEAATELRAALARDPGFVPAVAALAEVNAHLSPPPSAAR
jgi:hypothetical protein